MKNGRGLELDRPPQGERDGQTPNEEALRLTRVEECSKALNAALVLYRCRLIGVVTIRGGALSSQVEVESL